MVPSGRTVSKIGAPPVLKREDGNSRGVNTIEGAGNTESLALSDTDTDNVRARDELGDHSAVGDIPKLRLTVREPTV